MIDATQRALRYARNHGVTLVAAEGNGHTDLGKPELDDTSPDHPPAAGPRERTVDNSCLSMPTEGRGVIGVTSVGPSKRKAFYSDYGLEQADVSAPGGDSRDPMRPFPQNKILAPYPDAVGAAEAADPTTAPSIVEQDGNYWSWLQGTSMAAPHAVGVVALIVGEHGKPDRKNGGLRMDPTRSGRSCSARRPTRRAPSRASSTTPRTPPAPMTRPAKAAAIGTGSTATASFTGPSRLGS